MPTRGRKVDSDATPEKGIASESVRTAATVSPTETEIATLAHQLWLDNGCPVGSDHEDWLRAEAMLKSGRTPKSEELSRRPSIPLCDTIAASEEPHQFQWRGHWEVWEMEWEGPRWVWD